jgi:hypothetical protein
MHNHSNDVGQTLLPCPSSLTNEEEATKAGFPKGVLDDRPARPCHGSDCVNAQAAESGALTGVQDDPHRSLLAQCEILRQVGRQTS